MISEFGIRTTYLFFSYLTGGTALFYVVVYHLFLKKIRENRKLSRDKGLIYFFFFVIKWFDNSFSYCLSSADRKEVNGIENHGVELGENVEDTLNKWSHFQVVLINKHWQAVHLLKYSSFDKKMALILFIELTTRIVLLVLLGWKLSQVVFCNVI